MTKKAILNRNQIKWIAIAAMLIDHIAWAFVPTASLLGQVMHFIGRLTAPTMAFFVAEGYSHTRNIKKYILRMGIFAIVSWPAFVYYETGRFPVILQNGYFQILPYIGVIYTLFLGLLAITLWDQKKLPMWAKISGVVVLCAISAVGDWAFFNVLWCLFFHVFRGKPKQKWIGFSAVGLVCCVPMVYQKPWWSYLFMTGIFLVPFLIQYGYNGESGSKNAFQKWFFYIFYPLHLVLLGLLRWCF